MKLHIQTVHCAVESRFLEHLRLKLYKLAMFYDCINEVDVYLIEENKGGSRNKLVELLLRIHEFDLFTKHRATTFEEAAKDALEVIRHQLDKHLKEEMAYC